MSTYLKCHVDAGIICTNIQYKDIRKYVLHMYLPDLEGKGKASLRLLRLFHFMVKALHIVKYKPNV